MKILNKEVLADNQGIGIVKITIQAPHIAAKAKAGQFVVIMVKEEGERIPLTIVQADTDRGTIVLIAQAAGFTTKLLAAVDKGDSLYSMVGPLGHPTEIKHYGKIVLVGGGVGIAEIYPVAKAMKDAGNYITTIIGSRTKELLILQRELKEVSDEVVVMTDDGSSGRKGFVTEALKELLGKEKQDLVYAVGPLPMMRAVSEVTKVFAIHTLVSLNALMVDGPGMCGCCRVSVGGKVKFSCVDGPEFDAREVDWQELLKRNSVYSEKEKHICRLNNI
jgi:ferredoxin--NADP+ reductase